MSFPLSMSERFNALFPQLTLPDGSTPTRVPSKFETVTPTTLLCADPCQNFCGQYFSVPLSEDAVKAGQLIP